MALKSTLEQRLCLGVEVNEIDLRCPRARTGEWEDGPARGCADAEGRAGNGSSTDTALTMESADPRRDEDWERVLRGRGGGRALRDEEGKLDTLLDTPGRFRLLVRSGIVGRVDEPEDTEEREMKEEPSDTEGCLLSI